MSKACPHCGFPLHESSSFCPYCAKSVSAKKTIRPPRCWRKQPLYLAAALVISALALGWWFSGRPQVYDNGTAEAIYPSVDGDYQFCIAWANTPFQPAAPRHTSCELDMDLRYTSLLHINHLESRTCAPDTFLQKIDSITAEFVGAGGPLEISCTQPQQDTSYVPDAAAITYVDFKLREEGTYSADLIFTVTMKNGDIIRVRQEQTFQGIPTYNYTSEDAPIDTIADLQAFVDELGETIHGQAVVNVHLPPVVYEGNLTLDKMPVNFIGSFGAHGERTTFCGTVLLTIRGNGLSYFDDIDFVGSGGQVGLSVSSRLHLTGCRIKGWSTGVLCGTNGFVNADECVFEDNGVGFHFNSTDGSISDSRYDNNIFRNNDTALLLENVPTDVALSFNGSRFSGNGVDIDNQCRQELVLSNAVFDPTEDIA